MINFTFQKEISDIPMILPVEMFIVEEETAAPGRCDADAVLGATLSLTFPALSRTTEGSVGADPSYFTSLGRTTK